MIEIIAGLVRLGKTPGTTSSAFLRVATDTSLGLRLFRKWCCRQLYSITVFVFSPLHQRLWGRLSDYLPGHSIGRSFMNGISNKDRELVIELD